MDIDDSVTNRFNAADQTHIAAAMPVGLADLEIALAEEAKAR